MRILQVHTEYRQAGGEDSVVAAEHALLSEAGHTVDQIRFSNPSDTKDAARSLLRAPWNRPAAEQVVARARSFRADVVHVHNTWFALSPAVFDALSEAGFPTVATVHNYRFTCTNALLYRDGGVCRDCVGRGPWRGVAHACYRSSRLQSAAVAVTISTQRRRRVWSDHVDVVIALTRFAADLLETSGVPKERILIKANTTQDPGPRPNPPSAGSTVLFVGRLTEEKGVLDLVEAWERAEVRGLKLAIVGDGPLLPELLARRTAGVEVLGPRSSAEVSSSMSSARALVVPSRWYEGLPMVLVEAAASGTPALVPDHGALQEVVGGGGWVYPALDVEGLVGGLEEIASGSADERGREARRNFETSFSPVRGLERLEEAYERARRVSRPIFPS